MWLLELGPGNWVNCSYETKVAMVNCAEKLVKLHLGKWEICEFVKVTLAIRCVICC